MLEKNTVFTSFVELLKSKKFSPVPCVGNEDCACHFSPESDRALWGRSLSFALLNSSISLAGNAPHAAGRVSWLNERLEAQRGSCNPDRNKAQTTFSILP